MCSAVACITRYLFIPFPPLDERAARWLESDLSKPDQPWWLELLDEIDEEPNPP